MPKENSIPLIRPKRLGEALGLWMGGVIAPVFAVGSLIRRARVFHPRGIHFRATVEVAEGLESPFSEVAEGLAQDAALVRLSTGLYRSERGLLPDVLGFTIRFNVDDSAMILAQESSQDLLMVTSRSLLTLPIAALRTNQRDFLDNVYHGMAKFEIADVRNMRLRIVPLTPPQDSDADRYTKIRDAVADGDAVFQLEAASRSNPDQWIRLVQIHLQTEVTVDEHATMFWPFRAGQGIRPQGFVQFMRPVPYLLSQYARSMFDGGE
jgi:hypothetical protein